MSEYIGFRLVGASDSGKTNVWEVESIRHGDVLGEVRWFGRWRQYAFFPGRETVWNHECLDGVARFIREQMAARKA